jgi:type II secretory pathway pseudopilin PulG
MARVSGKIKASTLLEVIVAMVVILIVFVLATGIYANVMRSSPSAKQQKVKALMSGIIEKSITESNWNDEEIMIDSIYLIKKVLPYRDYADLKLLQVNAIEQGKEVGNVKRIVKMEGEP